MSTPERADERARSRTEQHFLPASFIGRFSLDDSGPWRKRKVWVQRVGRPAYEASAEYVGRSRRIYDREKPRNAQEVTIDNDWKYEPRLPEALNALGDRSRPLDARLWAEVLVPFVSSLFIRGLDFTKRYQERMPGFTGPVGDEAESPLFGSWHDATIAARLLEWQRIIAPVMSAEWNVVHGSGEPILITNDIAHCLMLKAGGSPEDVSYAFPVTTSSILVLERRVVRRILDWDGQDWTAPIVHRDVPDWELMNCRAAMQHAAQREVYGPTREAVMFPTTDFEPSVPASGAEALFPHFPPDNRSTISNRPLLPYLYDYFRVLTMLDTSPSDFRNRTGMEQIEWSTIEKSWGGMVQYIVDMPWFPGGLACSPFSVYLDLGRFTVEDVNQSIGRQSEVMAPASTEPRPELAALLVQDLRAKGIEIS
jgi:hypothetical protein